MKAMFQTREDFDSPRMNQPYRNYKKFNYRFYYNRNTSIRPPLGTRMNPQKNRSTISTFK